MKNILTITLLIIGLAACKTTQKVPTDTTTVTVVLEENITPESITEKTPFKLVTKKVLDKNRNKWQLSYDIGDRLAGELTGYLINKNGVVSVNGNISTKTPPIKAPRSKKKVSDM